MSDETNKDLAELTEGLSENPERTALLMAEITMWAGQAYAMLSLHSADLERTHPEDAEVVRELLSGAPQPVRGVGGKVLMDAIITGFMGE